MKYEVNTDPEPTALIVLLTFVALSVIFLLA